MRAVDRVVSRLLTPYKVCTVLAVVYFHSLFVMALLGQNILAVFLLLLHLIFAVRYVIPCGIDSLDETERDSLSTFERAAIAMDMSEREKVLFFLPPLPLLYMTAMCALIQLPLTAVLGPVAGKLDLFNQRPTLKVVFNSFGVWERDIFQLVVNIVTSVVLITSSLALCVILRRRRLRCTIEPHRCFNRISVLRLAGLTLLSALLYPTFDWTPILVAYFMLVLSFTISKMYRWKLRLMEFVSKAISVISIVLLAGGLCAQSPILQWQLMKLGGPNTSWSILWYEQNWMNMFTNFVVFLKGIQLLFLVYTIASSRLLHGSWGFITNAEVDEHPEYVNESPFSLWQILPFSFPAMVKKMQLTVGHYLPLAIVPIMVIVSLAVTDLVSILMLLTSFLGYILSSRRFVAVLPYCAVVISIGITLEFVAIVDIRLRRPFFMFRATAYFALCAVLLAQCIVVGLTVLSISMYRENPVRTFYTTAAEKKAYIRKAFYVLRPRLGELQDIFLQVCDSSSALVTRDKFIHLLSPVAHKLRFKDDDVEAMWHFLTDGDPVFIHNVLSNSGLAEAGVAQASLVHMHRQPMLSSQSGLNENGNDNIGPEYRESMYAPKEVPKKGSNYTKRDVEEEKQNEEDEEEEELKGWLNFKEQLLVMQEDEVESPLVAELTPTSTQKHGHCKEGELDENVKGEEASRSEYDLHTVTAGSSTYEDEVTATASQRHHYQERVVHEQEVEEEVKQEGEQAKSEDPLLLQQGRNKRKRASSFAIFSVGSPGSGLSYFDFLVLVNEIEQHRMANRNRLYVATSMLKQIISLNTSTLSLIAMFAASMTVKQLDVLNGMYILFFLAVACLPQYVRHCWFVVVSYTIVHVTILFVYLAYFSSYHPGEDPAHWIRIIGIYTTANTFSLIVYFLLLLLVVLQMGWIQREAKGSIRIQETLQHIEWRSFVSCAFFPQLRQHFFSIALSLVLAMMSLFVPANVLIAGFALLFLLYLSLGAYSKRAEEISLWALTGYNLMALLVSALYHAPDLSSWVVKSVETIPICQNMTAVVCASELGIPTSINNSPVSIDLLSWYLTSALCVALCRQSFRNYHRPVERRGNGDVADDDLIFASSLQNTEENEMLSISTPLVASGEASSEQIPNSARFNPPDGGKALFFQGYKTLKGTFTGRCVPMALEVTRYFFMSLEFIGDMGATYGRLLVCIAVGYASLHRFTFLGAVFMALFILDCRGMSVVFVSVVDIALSYVYPFFFVPEVPLPEDARRFLGLEKDANRKMSMIPPLLACVMAVFHEHTKKSRATRAREWAERRAMMDMNPRNRSERENINNTTNINEYSSGNAVNAGLGRRQSETGDEILQTNYVEFSPPSPECVSEENTKTSDTKRHVKGDRKSSTHRFGTVKQHILFMWDYLTNRLLIDTSFELTALVVVVGLSLTLDRVTGIIFSVQFFLMWLIGRLRSTTEMHFILLEESITILSLTVLYIICLGMPEGFCNISILHKNECGPWDYYLGCDLPVSHFILLLSLAIMQRQTRRQIGLVRATIPCVEGCLELGELMRKKRREVKDCQLLIRTDIENVLPAPSQDIIRHPQTFFDLLISITCTFLPAASFAFVQGVMMSSLLGVLESVASLCILAFKRSLAWRWYVVWPFFTLFLFSTFIPQLIVRLPFHDSPTAHAENIMFSLGVNVWSEGFIAGQTVVLFSAVIQQRIFNEFYFAAYLIGLCRGSLVAIKRRKEILAYIRTKNELLRAKVASQEQAMRKKLEQLFAERNMHATVVCTTEMISSDTNDHIPLLSPKSTDSNNKSQQDDIQQQQQQREQHIDEEHVRENQSSSMYSPETFPLAGSFERPGYSIRDAGVSGSDIFSIDNGHGATYTKPSRAAFVFSRVSAALKKWTELIIQKLSARTYRGKLPRTTYSQGYRLLAALMQYLMTKTSFICYFAFTLNFALSGTVLDMLPSIYAALYALLVLPWAEMKYWRFALIYSVTSILAKCVIQVIVRQFSMGPGVLYYLSLFVLDIGLDRTNPSSHSMMVDIIMDFVVFVTIIVHRQLCFDHGLFGDGSDSSADSEGGEDEETKKVKSDTSASPVKNVNETSDDVKIADTTIQINVDVQNSSNSFHGVQSGGLYHRKTGSVEYRQEKKQKPQPSSASRRIKKEKSSSLHIIHKVSFGVVNAVTGFWQNVSKRHGTGSDYYTVQFWADSLSLILFVAVYFVLSGNQSGNIIYSVQQDLLPGPLVVILFLLVILMSLERIVYVLHSTQMKFGLHIFTTLAYHLSFLVWRLTLAQHTAIPAVLLLLVKCFSMKMSALQLRTGYPLYRKHDPFTTNTDIFHWLGHTFFRAIPFLFELRLLLDWSVSPTALKVQHWMLLEDVHYTMYQRYVDMNDLAWTSKHKGRRFPFFVKVYQGVLGFAACLLVLFFPLMLYSTFNPNVGANRVVMWRTELTFSSTSRFYTSEGTDVDVDPSFLPSLWDAIPRLRVAYFGATGSLQRIMFPRCSAELWDATPETKLLLLAKLNMAALNKSSFSLYKHDEVLRAEASSGAQHRVRVSQQYVVPWASIVKLRDAVEEANRLNPWEQQRQRQSRQEPPHHYDSLQEQKAEEEKEHGHRDRHGEDEDANTHIHKQEKQKQEDTLETETTTATIYYTTGEWITLPLFYSPFVNNDPSDVFISRYVQAECDVQLNGVTRGNYSQPIHYWCFRCDSFINTTSSYEPVDNDTDGNYSDLYAIVASSDVTLQSSFAFLPNLGIIALYTTFILALGTFLRNLITGHAHRVVMMQVANPEPITELLRYIYMARSSASNGHLESLLLEQQLFLELVDLLRSPERVLHLSGRRVDDYDMDGVFQQHLKKLSERPF